MLGSLFDGKEGALLSARWGRDGRIGTNFPDFLLYSKTNKQFDVAGSAAPDDDAPMQADRSAASNSGHTATSLVRTSSSVFTHLAARSCTDSAVVSGPTHHPIA